MNNGTYAATTLGDAMSVQPSGTFAGRRMLPAEERARAILAEVDVTPWPESSAALDSITSAHIALIGALLDCEQLAAGTLHPSRIQPTDLDAGLPEENAPQWAADTAEQCAVILRDRLAQALADDTAVLAGERGTR